MDTLCFGFVDAICKMLEVDLYSRNLKLGKGVDMKVTSQVISTVHIDEYVYYGGTKDILDRGLGLVERAYRLDAENYMVQRLRAYVYFYTLSTYEFMQALDLALETNPYISTNGEVAPH